MQSVKHYPFPGSQFRFTKCLKFFTIILMAAFLFFPQHTTDACMGTPVPPCGRSVFLAKFTPGVVVIPPAGGAINVPIGVLPAAFWNSQLAVCPQPIMATLSLTLTCFPSGFVIGPQAFNVPVPTVPGPQPIGSPVNFVIPAGVFPPGSPPQICLVAGTYSVTFSDNVTLRFTGDTEVCIVPPSPLDDTAPRLDMQYIPIDGEDYRTCRRGDQANFYFLVANNDPNHAVSLNLNSIGRQVAQLPDGITPGDAYAMDVYAISQPDPDTDTFVAGFGDELMPGELLEESDPSVPDPQLLSRSFSLQPCEATIICIAMRSFGMCANGSCNERLVKVEGTFDNGDPALACASTLYYVDDVNPKSVLCEVLDSVKVHPKGSAVWSPANYGDANGPFPHAATFSVGNQANGGFLTTGAYFTDPFPSSASDYTRIDGIPMGVNYVVNFNSPRCGDGQNMVSIMGLDNPQVDLTAVPVIAAQVITGPLGIQIDLIGNQIVVSAGMVILYNGPIDVLFANPPPELCVDQDICRTFTKRFDQSEKAIFAEPPVVSRLFKLPNNAPGCDTLEVFDNNIGMAPWNAVINGAGILLPNASGNGMLEYCYDGIGSLPKVPATTISFIDISCPDALSPLRVPIAIRLKDTTVVSVNNPLKEDQRFILHSSTPNPFSVETVISFTLSEATSLQLSVFNSSGQKIRDLKSVNRISAGHYKTTWDATDNAGNRLPNGVYICQLKVADGLKTSKLALVQ